MLLTRLNNTLALFVITLCLMGLGLVMVYSTGAAQSIKNPKKHTSHTLSPRPEGIVSPTHSSYYLKRQALWIAISLSLIFLFYTLKQERFFLISIALLGVSVVMLVLVFVPGLGVRTHGAVRWLRLPFGLRFQPSELAKLSLVLFTAIQLSRMKKENLTSLTRGVPIILAPLAVVSLLILKEPDFGGTAVLCVIIFALLFAGGVKLRHLLLIGIIASIAMTPYIMSSKYRRDRILAFVYPERYESHANWQLNQSLIALGSGGLFGRGLGESAQKYHFLSEAHTDFIFSIICEELVLLRTTGVVLLLFALLLVSLRVVWSAMVYRASLIALGMMLMILIPALINMMVATKSGPAKGLALPFISYGGSSLIVNSIAIGILMNISRSREFITKRSVRRTRT
ncbi:cell division protein FtsW [Candidatus Sumerlaeota bacterium]|nr:cell division protein FtsW [Candidatus Sumerlaeota bacterium]